MASGGGGGGGGGGGLEREEMRDMVYISKYTKCASLLIQVLVLAHLGLVHLVYVEGNLPTWVKWHLLLIHS